MIKIFAVVMIYGMAKYTFRTYKEKLKEEGKVTLFVMLFFLFESVVIAS